MENQQKTDNKEISHIFLPTTRGKRFLNYILDVIFIYLFAIIFGFLIGFSGLYFLIENMNEWILNFIILMIYYVIFESIWFKTPAKFITKTKVIMENGKSPKCADIFARSLIRFIPFEPFSFLSPNRPKGWHDRWSKTMVIDDASLRNKEGLKKENKESFTNELQSPETTEPISITKNIIYCSKCGNKLDSDSKFCSKCGAKI